jgi:putative transposase
MAKKGGKRHSAEQAVKKLRDGETMLAAGKDMGHVLQALEISEATWLRWRQQYGGMQAEEAKRLSALERENAQLKRLVADQALDIRMLKDVVEGKV